MLSTENICDNDLSPKRYLSDKRYMYLQRGCYPHYVSTTPWSCTFYSHAVLIQIYKDTLLLHLLCNYGYTIVSILVCDIALKALLQGSYLLPFCLHLTFKTYIFVMGGIRDLLMLSLDFGDDVLQLCCLSTTLKVLFRRHFW